MSIDTIERAERISTLLRAVDSDVLLGRGSHPEDETERALHHMLEGCRLLIRVRAQTIRAKAEAAEEGSP